MRMSDVNVAGLMEYRSIEEVLADLFTKYASRPSAELARMIEHLQAEIADRKRSI